MPGKGTTPHPPTPSPTGKGRHSPLPQAGKGVRGDDALGTVTCDMWLNTRALWRNVPLPVWGCGL